MTAAYDAISLTLNRDRIRQRRPAFRRYTAQKVPVLVEHQVVVCIRFLALPPSWILQADLVLALPRAPEFHDYVLCAGCRSYAILTRKADPALAGQALLRTNRKALSPVPDLACGARLLDGVSRAAADSRATFRDDAGRRSAGAIFVLARQLSDRTRLAGSVFAYLAGRVGDDRF